MLGIHNTLDVKVKFAEI